MQDLNSAQNVLVKETDMNPELVRNTVDIVREAVAKCIQDKDVASYLKDTFEQRFGGTWHTIVGRSFGSRVSYESGSFILLKANQHSVLIYKCGSY
ncbi:dynein light chain protein [Aphelenchoides avenae]|nr:dynein light chain protein [Aphelenchus avenae]